MLTTKDSQHHAESIDNLFLNIRLGQLEGKSLATWMDIFFMQEPQPRLFTQCYCTLYLLQKIDDSHWSISLVW